ncbi:hypothetical protein [Actinomadura atramentaria]|uniref:hypothetical protein n=1 Tax=Actinomadura atramentaria TaxID=1990 RepID=UPI00037C0DBD|nr:hypothetical protein [Actinomadura atramentaria]
MTVVSPSAVVVPQGKNRSWTCFAIGPIGDRLAAPDTPEREKYEEALEIYESVTAAACKKYDIALWRADELPGSGEITEQICRLVRDADIVIADLGGGNANVMYELGMRHATGKPTIQIGDHKKLPFDVANIRTIRFERTPAGLVRARKELEAALEAGLKDGFEVLTPARIMENGGGSETLVTGAATPDDPEEPGLVEATAFLETELVMVSQDFDDVTKAIIALGDVTEESVPSIDRLNRRGAPPKDYLVAFSEFSRAIDGPVDALDTATARLSERMKDIDGSIRNILAFVAELPEDDRPDGVDDLLRQLVGLDASSTSGMAGDLSTMNEVMDGVKGLSRQLRKRAVRISTSLKRLDDVFLCVNEWAEMARALQ